MLSSKSTLTYGTTNKKDRSTGLEKLKPTAVLEYNRIKMGIDLSDQLSNYYSSLRKSIRWYHKVAFELLLGTCVINAYVLYKSTSHDVKKKTLLTFREDLICALTDADANRLCGVSKSTTHYLEKTKEVEGKKNKRTKRKACKNCYKDLYVQGGRAYARKKAPAVSTFCKTCPKKPFLCFDCFEKCHK